jgi:hypothetical protein
MALRKVEKSDEPVEPLPNLGATEPDFDQRGLGTYRTGSNTGHRTLGSQPMKRVPASYELTQEDIEEAIAYWLNAEHDGGEYDSNFNVTFKATEKRSPGKGPPGGMNDDIVTTVITAVAVKDE